MILYAFLELMRWWTLPQSDVIFNPQLASIPSYVAEYAPVVYLYSEEVYLPGNIAEYVPHFKLATSARNVSDRLSLQSLNSEALRVRNSSHSPVNLYMSAQDPWDNKPDWVTGAPNVPRLSDGAIVNAPAVLIVVDKGLTLDAFWFYFYPFNEGPYVMGTGPSGNHLGDWEHSLVRFAKSSGKPTLVWMSAHGGGSAYQFSGLEKLDTDANRPVIFAARGTHANYVSGGQHSHDIPWSMLCDYSDRGSLWDPAKNYLAYTFDGAQVQPANGSEPMRETRAGDWLLYDGCWGNKMLAKDDARQSWSPWEYKMIDGPKGPLFKNLMREQPCERWKWWNLFHSCQIHKSVTPGEGVEQESPPCAMIVSRFPKPIAYLLSWLFYRGWGCFFLDRFWS